MSSLPIPINLGPNRDIDEVALPNFNAFLYDGFVDSVGNVQRRPGLVVFCNLSVGSGVDGLFWWDKQNVLIAICNGKSYSINSNGDATDLGGDTLEVGYPVYFADFGDALYAANGGRILAIPDAGTPAYMADGDAPTSVRAIADLDSILLALEDDSEHVWYSQSGDATDWQGLFISEQYKPDLAKIIGVKNGIIEILGTQSLAGWRNDGSTPLVYDPSNTVDVGVGAPHSFRYCTGIDGQGNWYWLNHLSQIVKMIGRQVVPVAPASLSKYLLSFSTVSDAIGGECNVKGIPHYILTFPTENKTIAINLATLNWSEFGYWNTNTALHDRFRGISYAWSNQWNLQFVGDHTSGLIYKMDPTVYQDNGHILNTLIRTGNIDRGTVSVTKKPKMLHFWLKKGNVVSQAAAAKLMVKWRDNGKTTWKTEREISLGVTGETGFHGTKSQPGGYDIRQYQFSLTDNADLTFVRAEEEF